MTLDSHFAELLALIHSHPGPGAFDGAPEEMRERLAENITRGHDDSRLVPVQSVSRVTLSGGVEAQVMWPVGEVSGRATVVYLHPGGFATGRVELFEEVTRRLARDLDAVVLSLEYPLAPEHKSTEVSGAVLEAVRSVFDRIDEFGGQLARVGLVGESSGANLAAATAIGLRDAGYHLCAQLLISPFTDLGSTFPSESTFASGYFISARELTQIRELYLEKPGDGLKFPASPARARDLAGVAPTIVAVAEYDPLRDDGIVFAGRLLQAGVSTTLRVESGLIHPFFGMAHVSQAADDAVTELSSLLATMLDPDHRSPSAASEERPS